MAVCRDTFDAPPPPDVLGDLIWIQEAMRRYGRSRPWFDERLNDGRLGAYSLEGTKRLYLSRREIERRLLHPKVQRAARPLDPRGRR